MTESLALAETHPSAPVPSEFTPPETQQPLVAQEREKVLAEAGTGIKLTQAQKRLLRVEATHEIIEILPTGEIYVPGDKWRKTLTDAFDPLGWFLRKGAIHMDLHEDKDKDKSVLYLEVFLFASRCSVCMFSLNSCRCKVAEAKPGRFQKVLIASAIGAASYHPKNPRTDYDDAVESAVTNGIMRCGKAIGLYANAWDRKWAEDAKYAIAVKVTTRDWNNRSRDYWRRWDAHPLDGETGIVQGSPNADKYTPPASARPEHHGGRPGGGKQEQQAEQVKQAAPPAEGSTTPATPAKASALETPPANGEKILVIRPVNYKDDQQQQQQYWVVNTDFTEYVTIDPGVVRSLENAKTRAMRIRVNFELVQGKHGARKRIVEFFVIGPA